MMKISKRHLVVIGYVGNVPRRASMPSGELVVSFSVATSYSHPNGSGGYTDDTEWTDCKIKGSERCETFMRYVSSGTRIQAEGHLRTEKYTKEGQPVKKEVLIVESYIPLSKKNQSADSQETGLEIPAT